MKSFDVDNVHSSASECNVALSDKWLFILHYQVDRNVCKIEVSLPSYFRHNVLVRPTFNLHQIVSIWPWVHFVIHKSIDVVGFVCALHRAVW